MLALIDSPADLRRLHRSALPRLAEELRMFVLKSVAATGGHLSANLGTIELTIALHYVFQTPADRIVWDVGHQAYAHKILTGRRKAMAGIRQRGGISGFPRRQESEFDCFGTAHASTSLSAVLGMAVSAQYKGESRHCIAVIGDGALSGGMAFEALNNAGMHTHLPLLVILNDNHMSISKPVGALCEHLQVLARSEGKQAISGFFQALGFDYSGPIDGHDLDQLVSALRVYAKRPGPRVLHVVTRKGYGYAPAVHDPVLYHAPGKFDPACGFKVGKASLRTYADVVGQWLCEVAEYDSRVMVISPAMCEGSGLVEFQRRFPGRCFDVGIAEQHALTFAAGLAVEGLKPVVVIYSTFLQRAYDQLIHDIAIQHLPVVLAIDRAGVVGADGATHTGAFDIAYLRCIPGLVLMAPADENECRQMLNTALMHDGPAAVRYPRGRVVGVPDGEPLASLPVGRGEICRLSTHLDYPRVAILAFGSVVTASLEAAITLDATLANMRFIKPLDHSLLDELARGHDVLITVEEGCIKGGAGSACLEYLNSAGLFRPTLQLGFEDDFIEHATPEEVLQQCALDAKGIALSVTKFLGQPNLNPHVSLRHEKNPRGAL
ncbi:1-deoxy-D-xylulose-5-phosphate synthase [Pseudomonas sp. NPDC087639]|uniref:1-deoxy-D-xylulose-5-phosphate synthase n=1 Tax=Pseudomonas sp. NPDC087639 TaxID=3364445 RepID=UPI003824CA12